MKSIIEESSSIATAVEKAWHRAGMPAEFTIKIFQIPQKNFFGFTKISAKIGIFFTENTVPEKPIRQKTKETQRDQRNIQQPTLEVSGSATTESPEDDTNNNSEWTEELCDLAKNWLYGALKKMDKGNITIALKPQRHILKIQFSENLIEAPAEQERRFFGNLSHLMLSALRGQSQLPLRNLQVSMRKLKK